MTSQLYLRLNQQETKFTVVTSLNVLSRSDLAVVLSVYHTSPEKMPRVRAEKRERLIVLGDREMRLGVSYSPFH